MNLPMNKEIQLKTVLQKIDELSLLVKKHLDNPQSIPSIESALVMDKLQFAYDVYFKMANQAMPISEDKQSESKEEDIKENIKENIVVIPQAESTLEDLEEAAHESVIIPSEEEDMILSAEKEVELFIENLPEDVDEDFKPEEAEVNNEDLPDPELMDFQDVKEVGLFPDQQIEAGFDEPEKTGQKEVVEEIPKKADEPELEVIETKSEIVSPHEENMDLFSTAFDSEAKTVAEEISEKVNEESLAEKFQKNKITDLKEAIGINEKFYFINELFDGVMKEYNEAIETLNSKPLKEEALNHLKQIKEERDWKEDAEAFGQLKGILERKFD
jgi:hypothetical protein